MLYEKKVIKRGIGKWWGQKETLLLAHDGDALLE